jgi:lysophospholipase
MIELVATPDNPIPPGASLYELTTSDGASLRMARFTPQRSPRGTIALFQGRAEFIEKYFETIADLLGRGFEVVTLDWRGQGGSQRELDNPRKGHVDDFALYQRDLDALLLKMTLLGCPRPWFALAHSMGGAILFERAHDGDAHFARLVVTAPMIDLYGLRFPFFSRLVANGLDMLGFGAMFVPGGGEAVLSLGGDEADLISGPSKSSVFCVTFEGNKLTSDPNRFARNAGVLAKEPNLGIGDPTIGWVDAAFRQMSRFVDPDYPRRWKTPTLLISCGRDQIVSTPAIERFAQRLDIATLVNVPGARHEAMMERDELRNLFWAAFDAVVPGHFGTEDRIRLAG